MLMEEMLNMLKSKEFKEFKESDHRYVDEKLEYAFKQGGLKAFKDFIQTYNKGKEAHNKILVLLRGNSKNITIYKNNHVIWNITTCRKQFKVSFDFDHARYCSDWETKLNNLIKLGFVLSDSKNNLLKTNKYIHKKFNANKKVNGGTIGYISCVKNSFEKSFVEESYKIISNCIDAFFFDENSNDYFRKVVERECGKLECKNRSGVGPLVEKRWQQRLYWLFKNTQDGYYVYDLEFAQKFPSKTLRDQYNQDNRSNEPDMLAIRFEHGAPKALVLIEVKSTYNACKGDSGICNHIEGMRNYAREDYFVANRRTDAQEILRQYKEFGYLNGDISISEDLPIEIVLVLTNANVEEKTAKNELGAIKFYNYNKDDIQQKAKEKSCEIWRIDGNYYDERLHMEKVFIP